MTVKVKICGLSTAQSVKTALDCGADLIGLVFYPPSPRNLSLSQGAQLADQARGRAKIVALTVDAGDELLKQIASDIAPDYLQAHGSETPERVREIKDLAGADVIKAIKVRKADDIKTAAAYDECTAMALFDAKSPDDLENALPGGNGIAFDWSLLSSAPVKRPFMLSGGLDTGNVARALRETGAPLVDVSSGVESRPGEKDLNLIKKFIEAVRTAS